MFDNHFHGNGHNITIIQIVVHPPNDDNQINKPKKEKQPFWDKVKHFFAGCGSIFNFFTKVSPAILLLLTSC